MDSNDELVQLAYNFDRSYGPASELHLDGLNAEALVAVDDAVGASRRIAEIRTGDEEAAQKHADALRLRAEIRRQLVLSGAHGPGVDALEQFRLGLSDTQEAIERYRQSQTVARHVIPSLQLLSAEFACALGEPSARRRADEAITAYRAASVGDDEDSQTSVGRALARYSEVLASLGDRTTAAAARREAIERLRPYVEIGSRLWDSRHSTGTSWVTTPTLAEFGQLAYASASDLEPPTRERAPEALALLHAAAEVFAALIVWLPGNADLDNIARVNHVVNAQIRWLHEVHEDRLAERYDATARDLNERIQRGDRTVTQWPHQWAEPLHLLRPDLNEAIERTDSPKHGWRRTRRR